ncbi:MAG TPA: acetylxylan esterase, partial [Clostridia bacterium]|nr:acetylxylan esterase [Clostridia bacterium]
MKSKSVLWLVAVFWTSVAPFALQGAPLRLFTDRTNAIYQVGENVSFKLQLSPESKLAKTVELSWEISKDGALPIHTGTVCLVEGKASISGKLSEPGFLLCRVQGQEEGNAFEALAGAAIDPLAISPSLPVPEDFDAFWKGQKARLATVPMNPQLVPVGGD